MSSRADTLYNLGRYQEAALAYRQELSQDPENYLAACYLGVCECQLQNPKEAEKIARYAISLYPDHSFAYRVLALSHLHQNQSKPALKALHEELRLDPNEEAFILEARIYMGEGRLDKALQSLNEARNLSPAHPDIPALEAEIYATRRQPDLALQKAQEALALAPDDSDSHIAHGLALTAKGDKQGAEAAFREAIRLDPTDTQAKEGLKTAVRHSFPLYRQFHRHQLWYASLPTNVRWILPIGLFIIVRVSRGVLSQSPNLQTLGTALAVAYGLFLCYLFLVPTLSNLTLLSHPVGKYALERNERSQTLALALFLGIGLLLTGIAFAFQWDNVSSILIVTALFSVFMGLTQILPYSSLVRNSGFWTLLVFGSLLMAGYLTSSTIP